MATALKSAELKLVRAARHIRAIKKRIAAYSARKPHQFVCKPKRKKKLNIPQRPPDDVALLAGEAVYQMRSALDHLAFALVKRNHTNSVLPKNWEQDCQFPIWVKPLSSHQRPPLRYNIFKGKMPGISKEAFTFVESVQPYYGVGAINHSLRFLAHLSNIDKHRHLNTIRGRVQMREKVRFADGVLSSGTMALDRGAVLNPYSDLGESYRTAHVHRRYTAFVAFKEREVLGDASALPVDRLLNLILKEIKVIVIPKFREFLKKP